MSEIEDFDLQGEHDLRQRELVDFAGGYEPATVEVSEPAKDLADSESKASIAWTLIVFMLSLVLLRFIMPGLVEEVHYAIERGKQRARYDIADDQLSKTSHSDISAISKLVTQRIAPSVVHIDTTRSGNGETDGQGSGVVLSTDGEIVTNYHVIAGAEEVLVTLYDDQEFLAKVIGVDESDDLALLKIDSPVELIPATWGDSEALETGSMVWAVGSPFGLSKSTTFGILSAKGRRSREQGTYKVFLQSDAAVHAGNSGGPLVDSLGHVVGINTAIIGRSFQGVSFSIPSNRAQRVYDNVLSKPTEERGWLGVRLASLPGDEPGVMISSHVTRHSPAQLAGIRKGDVIKGWNDVLVDSPSDLSRLVGSASIDEDVRLIVERQAERTTMVVKIGARPLQF